MLSLFEFIDHNGHSASVMGLDAAPASRQVRMLGDLLATPTRDHLLGRASNRVVPFVWRHLNLLNFGSGEDIETSITSLLQILSSEESAHIGIVI